MPCFRLPDYACQFLRLAVADVIWVARTELSVLDFNTSWEQFYSVSRPSLTPVYRCEIVHTDRCRRMLWSQYCIPCLHHLHKQILCLRPSSLISYVNARLFILVSVEGFFDPSTVQCLHHLHLQPLCFCPWPLIVVCRCEVGHTAQHRKIIIFKSFSFSSLLYDIFHPYLDIF